MPSKIGKRILDALFQFEKILNDGVLIILDEKNDKARILPLNP